MFYGFRISKLLANFTVEKLKITHQKSKKMKAFVFLINGSYESVISTICVRLKKICAISA